MKYKGYLFINYTKKMIRTPSRMVLTLSGLILSVVILMIGLIFSETYLKSKLSSIESYRDYNAFVVEGDVNYNLYESLAQEEPELTNIELTCNYTYLVKKTKHDTDTIMVAVREIRTDKIIREFLYKDDMSVERYSAKLVAGRLLDYSDTENETNAIVIGESLAKALYGENNPIGQKVIVPIYKPNKQTNTLEIGYYEELEVVGVITDSQSTLDEIKTVISSESETQMIVMPIYLPLSYSIANKELSEYDMRITTYSNDKSYLEDILRFEEIVKGSKQNENYQRYNYFSLKMEIEHELESVRGIIFYIVLFMFFISGIGIVNTMFFSVKERINEIGIRKSIGAFNEDIVVQFIYEGMLYGLIASVIGVVFSILISSSIYILMGGYRFWNTNLVISKDVIFLSFAVSILIGIIAGIMPAIYAARIKVVEAIRYD